MSGIKAAINVTAEQQRFQRTGLPSVGYKKQLHEVDNKYLAEEESLKWLQITEAGEDFWMCSFTWWTSRLEGGLVLGCRALESGSRGDVAVPGCCCRFGICFCCRRGVHGRSGSVNWLTRKQINMFRRNHNSLQDKHTHTHIYICTYIQILHLTYGRSFHLQSETTNLGWNCG